MVSKFAEVYIDGDNDTALNRILYSNDKQYGKGKRHFRTTKKRRNHLFR